MAPTTVTTIVLILFGLGVLALTAYAWFGSWEPVVRAGTRSGGRATHQDDVEVAVLQMRRSIEDYERRQRP